MITPYSYPGILHSPARALKDAILRAALYPQPFADLTGFHRAVIGRVLRSPRKSD